MVVLAYTALAYAIASIIYLIGTRHIGTPFRDSLTKDQLEIKKSAAQERKCIFLIGLVVAAMILIIVRPFKIN